MSPVLMLGTRDGGSGYISRVWWSHIIHAIYSCREAFRAAAISHICVSSVIKTQKLLDKKLMLESQMAKTHMEGNGGVEEVK